MTDYKYPTAYSSWDAMEIAAMSSVRLSGRYTMGKQVELFEREFADWHHMSHGIMVNSGSSANLVMAAALFHLSSGNNLRRGDKAIVPALAWATTYAPLVQHGLDLILADADDTWNASIYGPGFDPQDARLVVGCPVLGNPHMASAWASLAGVMGGHYVEDNCESLGALDNERRLVGTRGLMNTFSFFWSHQLSAIEGGMILTDDDECANLCLMLRDHGLTRSFGKAASFGGEYDFQLMGYNVRPLEMHAAIAREQLKKLPGFIDARRGNENRFRELTAGLGLEYPDTGGAATSPFGIAFRVPKGRRDAIATALRAASIDCRPPTGGSLGRHAYGHRWASQATPRADDIHDRGMFIGNPPWPAPEFVELAATVLRGEL